MSKPDPPAPPDPIRTAAGATATNVGTAVANAYLNNVNQVTPEGALQYDTTGTYAWSDPTTGQTYNIPTFTATQQLSPQQQEIQRLGNVSETNLAGLAANQSGMLQNLLGQPLNFNGAPGMGDINWLYGIPLAQSTLGDVGGQQRSLGDYGQQQTTFGDAGDVTRSYGPADGFSADRQRVEEAMYQRMDPQLQRDRQAMEQRLSDQGVQIGSPAWQASMDQFNRQLTDTRLGITERGGQEQKLLTDMAAQRAGFQNAAQQQAYQQALGRGTFANAAQAQQFQEKFQAGTFANQAQSQDFSQAALRGQFANQANTQNMARNQAIFSAQNALRGQNLQEQQALRNQPINEITALLSGSQVNQPNWVQTGQNNIPTTDIAGLINNKFSQDMSVYQQNSQNFNQLMGGIFGAIGGMARSDRRVKENIDKVGTIFAAGPDGEKPLPIYEYSFKDDPASTKHVGPMAQDVEKVDKKAVRSIKGVQHIDMTRMGSILRAA